MIILIFLLVIAYLLGSINSAIIVSKLMNLPDPRQMGSGNPGATNMLRTGNKNAAILALVGDALKGIIAVFLAKTVHISPFELGLVTIAVVLGHLFPLYFKFQGGKGVATTFGALITLSFWLGLIIAIIWIAVALFSRFASLAAIVSVIIAPFLSAFMVGGGTFVPLIIVALLVIWRHKDNLNRIRAGTENKIGK